MNNNVIVNAVKEFGYTLKDILRIEQENDLKGKVYLKNGKGCLFLEGWETEVRRKRTEDGRLVMFKLNLPEPRFRARLNNSRWWTLPDTF